MVKDDRLYAKFTIDFPDHRKIAILSDAAFRCWFEAIMWSRRQLTDGFVPQSFANVRWSFDIVQELCQNDPLKPSFVTVDGGYQIHDFELHQTTRSEIEERRERRRAAGQKAGIASGLARRERSRTKPERSRTKRERLTNTETETETEITTTPNGVVDARGTRLPDDWQPPPDVVAQMRSDHPHIDLQAEHLKFVDYWKSQPGVKGRKTDWAATWRNWIRNSRAPTFNGTHTHDDKVNDYLAYANQPTPIREIET